FIAEPFSQPVDGLLGLGAAAVDEVGEIGPVGVAERREADADQAKHGAVGFAREQVAPGGENPPGELGRVTERRRPRADTEGGGRIRKSAVWSFSVTVEPASAFALRRAETFSARRHSRSSSGRKSAMSWSKVVSAEMLLASRSALTGRSSRPRAR